MASIDLPRALQDYFAFAETTPTRNGRRFSITLPYVRPDGRLDRLQWWYHLSAAKEMALGDSGQESLRAEAIERFTVHIERWLHNTRQDLYGNRVVGAYRVDPTASEGLAQNGEDDVADSVAIEHNAGDVNAAEMQEAGGSTPAESDHRPANKSAFG
jgi:hypothetical protein